MTKLLRHCESDPEHSALYDRSKEPPVDYNPNIVISFILKSRNDAYNPPSSKSI